MIVEDDEMSIRLQWGAARVPQIETYFERYHGSAVAAVRVAAFAALSSLDETVVTRYFGDRSLFVERRHDCLGIGAKVTQGKRLSIYAKWTDRIRFEVQRSQRGRYPNQPYTAPPDRLLHIFNIERENARTAVPWHIVGSIFEERDSPILDDLCRFVGSIADACAVTGAPANFVTNLLVANSGLGSSTFSELGPEVVERLIAQGVLRRVTLRNRDCARNLRHFSLTPEYRLLFERLIATLHGDAVPQ